VLDIQSDLITAIRKIQSKINLKWKFSKELQASLLEIARGLNQKKLQGPNKKRVLGKCSSFPMSVDDKCGNASTAHPQKFCP
jgi:hypothetical protein